MNILTIDNLKKFLAPGNKIYPVDIVENLGAYAYKIAPNTFCNTTLNPKEMVDMFSDSFTLSSRWVFNLWMDTSHSIYAGSPYKDGFVIWYTDGTNSGLIGPPIYDENFSPEYKHVLFISSADKSIASITLCYTANNPVYYRIDSTITPYSEYVNINKKGLLNVGELFESKFYITDPKNTICDATFNVGGTVECNQIIEY